MKLVLGLLFGIVALWLLVAWLRQPFAAVHEREPIKPSLSIQKLPSGPVALRGNGEYDQDIVGESFYQAALDATAGGPDIGGVEEYVTARIMPQDDNPHDANAVAVLVRGEVVGHFARNEAPVIRDELIRIGLPHGALCDAVVVGGWYRDDDDFGHFGLKLDVVRPLKRK